MVLLVVVSCDFTKSIQFAGHPMVVISRSCWMLLLSVCCVHPMNVGDAVRLRCELFGNAVVSMCGTFGVVVGGIGINRMAQDGFGRSLHYESGNPV